MVPKALKFTDLTASGKSWSISCDTVDATGAGDSYDAAFICGLAEGKNVKEAAQMGAAAGALNAAAFGPMEGNISRVTVKEMIKLHEK